MRIDLPDGPPLFAATGGAPFDPSRPVVVLVHGTGADRTFWRGQSRYLAHHGYAVLAVDLPGHGQSPGPSLGEVEEMADRLVAALDVLGVDRAALVGHSLGALVTLDLAGRHPGRVTALALLGVRPEMAVHPALLDGSRAGDHNSIDLKVAWGTGEHAGGTGEPGAWVIGGGVRLAEASGYDAFADDFAACARYGASEERASRITCPSIVVSGSLDRMTTRAGGQEMADLLGCAHVVVEAGHDFPVEAPWPTTEVLTRFLSSEALAAG